MRDPKRYWVYILANNQRSRVLYVGITGNLPRRAWEHKKKLNSGFTSRYNLDRLVYYDPVPPPPPPLPVLPPPLVPVELPFPPQLENTNAKREKTTIIEPMRATMCALHYTEAHIEYRNPIRPKLELILGVIVVEWLLRAMSDAVPGQ